LVLPEDMPIEEVKIETVLEKPNGLVEAVTGEA
jgi:hypothetical protein